MIAFGRQGMFVPILNAPNISLPFTVAAVIVAQTFVAASLYVRSARIGFAEIDIQIEEAALVEGANQWQLFSYVMFPLAGRTLVSGAILTWTRALGDFGATMLFAGNLEGITQTMPMAIYLGFERNLGIAIAFSVVLIRFSVILLTIIRHLEQRNVHGSLWSRYYVSAHLAYRPQQLALRLLHAEGWPAITIARETNCPSMKLSEWWKPQSMGGEMCSTYG